MLGTIAAVVLAAGRGTRLESDTPKPCVLYRGMPLVAHALDAAIASGLGPVVLVVGHEADQVAACAGPGVEVVVNPNFADGIASSLHAAIEWLAARGIVHAAVVGLADQPDIGPEAWQRLAAQAEAGTTLAVATYDGERSNPVLIARDLWPAALALSGDEGARQLMRTHLVVEVACDGTGDPHDIDTADDIGTD